MEVKVAFNWSQPSIPHSPSSPQTLASSISSPPSKRRSIDSALVCRNVYRLDRSSLFGPPSINLYRSRSSAHRKSNARSMKRACSATFDSFSDEEFAKQLQELALKFQLYEDDAGEVDEDSNSASIEDSSKNIVHDSSSENTNSICKSNINFLENQTDFLSSKPDLVEPPDWHEVIPASIERKANSVELPFSLRMIKKKKQWEQGIKGAGESAYSSVKLAFSSMVFIIQELQSYILQMREILFYEDLQGILARVQKDMNASFVWLFQQVFSHTPILMVYVMILLANYSVHSISSEVAIASIQSQTQVMESSTTVIENQRSDTSAIKTFSDSKTASTGGNNGGGGKFPVIGSGTDGDGSVFSEFHRTFDLTRTSEEMWVSGHVDREEESKLWNAIVDEASGMEAEMRDEALDHETMQRFVSPVSAEIEEDKCVDYFRTELLYQARLSEDPSSSLLLANYAQFLFLVAQDYDRAEDYFKRAVKVEPKDPEAFSKYASFLWRARNDLWAAEETYLEAISIESTNSHYAAIYAHFLWNTGGEDTCFPLDSPDTDEV
ncbi:hypothetical protein LguiA_020876 [Lonicera macranthoides]